MNLRIIVYTAFISAAAAAFTIGSSGPSEAKAKKVAPPPHPGPCFELYAPVCGAKGGLKFTYANSCYAGKDGASIVSQGACPAKKAKPHKKHKKAKKAAKPAKKDMKPAAADKKKDEKK